MQKVHIQLVDDIDGNDAAETVTFGLDGKMYEIDLNDKNAGKLRKALTPFVENGRKVNGTTKKRTQVSNAREIRDWARSNGYEVSPRGSIPAEVREAFAAAHA